MIQAARKVPWLDGQDLPEAEHADEDGLVALGGSLDPDLLLSAYRKGIFPWSSRPVLSWWSPDPRAVFDLASFREHRSVRRSAQRAGWRFQVDSAFTSVMRACAAPQEGRDTTWITSDFITAYTELHRRGHAHSIEVYEDGELVGGLYGVAIGGYFGGESMFHRRTDASKAAVGHLVSILRRAGFVLLDAQAPTPHLLRIGAVAISRQEYLRRLCGALKAHGNLRAAALSEG